MTLSVRELQQVLLVILTNAKEALLRHNNEDRRIAIHVSQKSPQTVCIALSNNAGMIDTAIIHDIFNPYFTTKEEHQRAGLGLYIAKTIVEKHLHGTLEVYNEAHGVRFEILLPTGAQT
ncbi:MAG: GHKL domain-containing protein [Campylobacterales bacterium]|nr:GHKL domain-containing protein [Campylobacterales bacterium]